MATIYEETPTFEERVEGALLIIVGRVEKPIDVRVDHSGDPPQVQTVFRVNVESVLKGKFAQASLKVRVVGGKAEKVETDWSVRMNTGDQMLLMLAPDYGPDYDKDMFVPYFRSCYPVKEKGVVKLDEDTAKELTSQEIRIEKATAKLADLRSIINRAMQRREKEAVTLAEMEPAELREMPYDEVGEMPQAELGEARPASPESGPEELREAD